MIKNMNEWEKEIFSHDIEEGVVFWYKPLKKFIKSRREIAYELLKRGNRFLDIGSGDGWLTIKTASKFKKSYGIERLKVRNDRAKKIVQKFGIKNVFFKTSNLEEGLPFDSCYFDGVAAVGILEYVKNCEQLISEIARVLKLRGKLIVQVPNIAYLPERIKFLFGRMPFRMKAVQEEDKYSPVRVRHFTQGYLIDILQKNNFKILKVTGSGFFRLLRAWWPSLLTGDLIILARKH